MQASSFSDLNPSAELRLGDQLICYDREATQQAYTSIRDGSADRCGCPECRNFIAIRSSIYPTTFLGLLNLLGIDSVKEAHLYAFAPPSNGTIHYGGWLFFYGKLLQVGERSVSDSGIRYFVNNGHKAPTSGSFGADALAVEFDIEAPWVLDEKNHGLNI